MNPPVLTRSALAFARREIGLVAALFVAAVAVTAFLHVADEVAEGETAAFDRAVLLALRAPGDPHLPIGPHWLRMAAGDLTALGSIAVLATVVLIVGGLFASLGRRREALVLLVASGGGVALSQGLKLVFNRPRPEAAFHAAEVVNASFPSGHAMLSACVYLTLGALAARFAKRRAVKVYGLAAALACTLIVGATRVYLGVHWPTDVLAGWSVGAAWAMACWLLEWGWERLHPRAALSSASAEGADEPIRPALPVPHRPEPRPGL